MYDIVPVQKAYTAIRFHVYIILQCIMSNNILEDKFWSPEEICFPEVVKLHYVCIQVS